MATRATECDFLSAFLGGDKIPEPLGLKQHIAAPLHNAASRKLHSGYIRPLHLTAGERNPTAKFQRVSEEDFWDSKDGPHSPQIEAESLPKTAAKTSVHRVIEPAISTVFHPFEECPKANHAHVGTGSADSIMFRVRPGLKFNRMQTSVKNCIFNSNESSVVGAPTGAIAHARSCIFWYFLLSMCLGCGKTVIMEMAICRLYHESTSVRKAIPKILYIAPIKQLVTEKRLEWERCLTRK